MGELTTPAPVPETAVHSFMEHTDEIIERTVQAALADDEAARRLGPDPETMLATGLRFTTQGLVTAMKYQTLDLLADQIQWATDRLPHDGVPATDMRDRFLLYRNEVQHVMPAVHATHVVEHVDWMIAYLDQLDNSST